MVQRCAKCGNPTAKYPIRGQPDKTFVDNIKEGTIIWGNVFRIDWFSLFIIITILFIAWSYSHDTEECRQLITQISNEGCSFCTERTNCCSITDEPLDNIEQPILNLTQYDKIVEINTSR